MPYEVEKDQEIRASGSTEKWNVVNTETQEVVASHEGPDAEKEARDQVRLLNEIEKDPEWDKDDD